MTLKEYQKVKIVFIIVLSFLFSLSFQARNYLVPIALLVAGTLFMTYLRRKVKGVIADERDYTLGGKAALLAIQAYSWVAVVAMFIFYALRDLNPSYESIGMTLAFSTMILLLVYATVFRYYERISFTDKKFMYSLVMLLLFAALFVAGVRGLSGEDGWICEDGKWIEHGHPDFAPPEIKCE
jgi:uncharacterized membrane protein